MKRLLYFVITLFVLTSTLTAQETVSTPHPSGEKEITLLEALKAIEQSQSEYSINIVSDGLDGLTVEAKTDGLDAVSAVKRLCKGLPVKVKVHGRRIYVQLERGKAMRKQTAPTQREIAIKGDVKDGFLKIPLIHAKVSICRADSSVLVDSAAMTSIYTGNMRLTYALYSAKVTTDSKTLLVHATLKGYEGVWQSVNVGKQTEVDVPTLEMRKVREIELGEVLVKATRVKMFYRGDTIVYDATAFKLPEGSMLDDLIRQMPGVTLNEAGEIFVNGRKVDELLLGAHSFMRGNKRVLMENLPYYTVKEIKVYEKESDKSMALGYSVDPKMYVMDVNLKEEYQRGYIANVEGAIGTNDRWLARAFALGFTDRLRFTLLGNLNNVNESRHIGESGNWTPATMPNNMLTTRSLAGEIDYYSKGDKVKNNLTASYTSTTDIIESRSRYEQFLQGLTPTSLTENVNRTGNRAWNVHDAFTLNKHFHLYVVADFNYSKNHGGFSSTFDQWNDSLVASNRTQGFSENKTWNGYIEAQGAFNIGTNQKHIDYYIKAEQDEYESESARIFKTRQFMNSSQNIQHNGQSSESHRASTNGRVTKNEDKVNADDISNRTTWGVAMLGFNSKIFKKVNMGLRDNLYLSRIDAHDWLYHPERSQADDGTSEISEMLPSQIDALSAVTDVNNSYESRTDITENTFALSFFSNGHYKYNPDMPFSVDYQRWRLDIDIPMRHESLDYQRGRLDTLATQNTLFLNTSASFRNVSEDGKLDLRVHASHKRSGAFLSDRISYRDDSQPLVVKLGNPDLKSIVSSNLGIDFWNKGGQHQQQWHVGASADIYHRQTAQSVSYNAETGVYTYQPMNVNGAYRLNGKFDISRAIDKNRYWTWQTNADAGYHHSVDHAMLTGLTASEENIVNTLTLHDGAYIQYNKGTLNIRATGDIRWRHSEGKMYDFETLNATDFQYGLSARYTLPRLNTTLSADGNMYSRRGYGSSELNTDDFVLNASISQPFLKGKLIARLEAFDLLHQLSNTQYTVNAQGRTETWYRSLPHYVMLHLVYHWSRQNSKRKANLD